MSCSWVIKYCIYYLGVLKQTSAWIYISSWTRTLWSEYVLHFFPIYLLFSNTKHENVKLHNPIFWWSLRRCAPAYCQITDYIFFIGDELHKIIVLSLQSSTCLIYCLFMSTNVDMCEFLRSVHYIVLTFTYILVFLLLY